MHRTGLLLAMICGGLLASDSLGADPTPTTPTIHALLITGHNNHNWRYTSRQHEDTLEATGRFTVDITDEPAKTLADAAALKKYQVFILDYNDSQEAKRWGDAAEKNFTEAVNSGTGVVAIHSANNAFKGWADYEKMLGLMWREGTGHGDFHTFDVTITDKDHPITRGLSDFSKHPDELYHKLVNSQNAQYHLLANAKSTEKGGSGAVEPMAFTLEFGKGRIFATPLGHVWLNSPRNKPSISDPNFRTLLARGTEWAATGKVTLPTTWSDVRPHNVLTSEEKAAGWVLLFDGKSTTNFRSFKQKTFPDKGWSVENGVLKHAAGAGGGDLITDGEYGDFEFVCDWKMSTGGNSGIIYRSTEDHDYPWQTGPEYQLLDDLNHADGKNPKTCAGTMYAVAACAHDMLRPVGEWNHARIVAKGTRIEHWLNGVKVVDLDLAGDAFRKAKDESKWKDAKDYASKAKGHIALQDHGDLVEFRDIKVKKLD